MNQSFLQTVSVSWAPLTDFPGAAYRRGDCRPNRVDRRNINRGVSGCTLFASAGKPQYA
jgi:hypothetical protein